jgi:hypothetical protein
MGSRDLQDGMLSYYCGIATQADANIEAEIRRAPISYLRSRQFDEENLRRRYWNGRRRSGEIVGDSSNSIQAMAREYKVGISVMSRIVLKGCKLGRRGFKMPPEHYGKDGEGRGLG